MKAAAHIFTMTWPWAVVLSVILLDYTNVINALVFPTHIVILTIFIPPLAVIINQAVNNK